MAAQDEPPPISELIQRARAGDAGALEILLHRYREFVRLLIRHRSSGQLRGRVDSSDMVQETLLKAAQNLAQFHGEREEEWCAWLGRIAEREVIAQRRLHVEAAKRTVTREQSLDPGRTSFDNGLSRLDLWCVRSPRSPSSPSRAALRKERAQLLADALARLPEDYREVLVLRHLEGREFSEIAERLRRSNGAVRVLWTRALKKLREELARHFPSDSGGAHG
jgi:RNA polymerase sigma-70 factor (ECF subfamily)